MPHPPRPRRRTALALLAGLASAPLASRAQADDAWPSKPITYVVPFLAGGTTDVLARLIGPRLSAALGTPVLIENRPGAGGNTGSEFVAKAPADGYTLLGGTISSHAINASLYPRLPYDPVKSFAPITLIGSNANVLVVAANSPFKTVQDLIREARAQPGMLSYASAGNGTSQHLSSELLKHMAGLFITHLPYRGSGPAIQDVVDGQVALMFDTSVVALPLIESGRLRALAVSSARRLPQLPQVPTLAEAGVPGYDVVSWQAVFAPAQTPVPIVQRLHAEIAKILHSPDLRERLSKLGLEPSGMAPEQLAAFQKAEIAKWARVIKAANVRLD